MSPRRRAGSGGPLPFGAFLGRAASGSRLGPALRRGRLMAAWPAAVGPQLAQLTWPVALQGKTLVVAVSDHALATVLRYQLPRILERLRAEAGGAIAEIRLTVQPRRAPTLEGEVDAGLPAAAAPAQRRTGDAAERLDLARRRLAALWSDRTGPACELCGAVLTAVELKEPPVAPRDAAPVPASPPAAGVICAHCARLLEEPRILALARRLVGSQELQTGLDEVDREAVTLLARLRLAGDLRELARQVVTDSSLRPYLEALSRRYLQLAGWEGPAERGAHLLPAPELAGLLGWN